MKKMLCVWMMLVSGAVCAQAVLQDVPDTTVVGPSNDPFLFSVIRGNAAYGTNALAVANEANATALNASNRIAFSEGTINALASTQRVVVAQMGALVSTQAVQSVTISNAFALGMAAWVKANEAFGRPSGTDTGVVESLAGVLVSNHNLSDSAHEDIRASVSNAVESISLSVKTNSVGGVEVGTDCVASGKHSMAFGYGAIASGVGSRSMGYFTSAIGNYSIAEGSGTTTSGNNSRAFGQGSIAAGAVAFAAGLYSEASGTCSISLGYAGISSGYCSFVWSGYGDGMMGYSSHGDDTFNINPENGASGFYIGETNLQTYLDGKASGAAVEAKLPKLSFYDTNTAAYVTARFEFRYTNGVNRLFIFTE